MEAENRRVYRLYALPMTGENIALAAGERFSRATPTPEPGYVLVYTDGNAPTKSVEVTADTASLLTPPDIRWLIDCGAAVAAEELEKHRPEVLRDMSEKIEALETELRKKKEELNRKGE